MKNKIEDLRNHLFETLEALKDAEKPMDVERAGAIANVARVIVDSAKVEVAFMNAAGNARGTGFIAGAEAGAAPAPLQLTGTAAPIHICASCKKRAQRDPCEHCDAPWKRVA